MYEEKEDKVIEHTEGGGAPQSHTYDFNFFKPTSEFAKSNSQLITTIIIVWALAVFGFHFLMKAIEKPVPEKHLATFEEVWPNVKEGTASRQQLQDLAGVYLNLMGRHISLRTDENFKLLFTSTVYDVLPANEKPAFLALTARELAERKSMASGVIASLGLEKDGLLAQVVPYALTSYDGQPVDAAVLQTVPATMQKYLVHYRSVLTDTKFLGFPFHYFYTAIFLLVLFVLLCLVYCKAIDKIVAEHGMEDDEV